MVFSRSAKLTLPLALAAIFLMAAPAKSHAFGPERLDGIHNAPWPSILRVKAEAGDEKAEGFVKTMGSEAVAFLGDDSLSVNDKQEKFRKLLNSKFDMQTIGRFTIGKNWKTLSAAQQKEYQKLFENLIVSIYSSKFADYHGQTLEVDGSRPQQGNDVLVNSFIVPQDGQKIPVDWQVRSKDGQQKIVDVVIEGVSMAITKRSEFDSIIQRGGGDPEVLLDYLRGKS